MYNRPITTKTNAVVFLDHFKKAEAQRPSTTDSMIQAGKHQLKVHKPNVAAADVTVQNNCTEQAYMVSSLASTWRWAFRSC